MDGEQEMTWYRLTDKTPPLHVKLAVLGRSDADKSEKLTLYKDEYVGRGEKFKNGCVSWSVVWWCELPEGVEL